jgi:hypothetical protein
MAFGNPFLGALSALSSASDFSMNGNLVLAWTDVGELVKYRISNHLGGIKPFSSAQGHALQKSLVAGGQGMRPGRRLWA